MPDFGGLWEITSGGGPRGAGEPRVFTLEYAARLEQYRDAVANGDIEDGPAADCVPNGMLSIMTQPYPIEIRLAPGKVTILIEAYSQWRQIFTDGRPHPVHPDLTYNGHSIGHWEGDTLVVDTVGFTTDTSLGLQGMRHSDKMHIVERFRLVSPDRLEVETTIVDPEALTQAYTRLAVYGRHRDWTLAEHVGRQNNRNFTTEDGKAGIDLRYVEDL